MIKFFKQENTNKGFTLVETLIAISIFSLSILALTSVLSQGISNTGYAKMKIIAGYLSQEGIEYIRNMRDNYILYSEDTSNEWVNFLAKLAPCNKIDKCGFNTAATNTDPSFIFTCASNPDGCKIYLSNGSYNTNSVGADSGFTRTMWKTTVSADEVKVYSVVYWTKDSSSYSITLSDHLFNWVE